MCAGTRARKKGRAEEILQAKTEHVKPPPQGPSRDRDKRQANHSCGVIECRSDASCNSRMKADRPQRGISVVMPSGRPWQGFICDRKGRLDSKAARADYRN